MINQNNNTVILNEIEESCTRCHVERSERSRKTGSKWILWLINEPLNDKRTGKNLQYTLKIMRLVIQQVKSAKLDIEESNIHRKIGRGIIIYLGIHVDDLDTYPEKIARIMKKFPLLKWLTGPDGNINTSLQDIDGEVLLVSNFTLYGRSTKGTKLDFVYSAPYKKAEEIYNYFIDEARVNGWKIQTGEFGANMTVTSVNEGPLNYVFDY